MSRTSIEYRPPSGEHAPTAEEHSADEGRDLYELNEPAPATPRRVDRRWTRGEWVVVVAGTLLVVDLAVAPWHHVRLDPGLEQFGINLPGLTYDRRAIQDPQAFFGRAALVVAAAMVLQVVAAKLVASVPRWEQVHLVAGPVALGLLIAKLIANNDFLGFGALAGTALGALLAYGGFLLSQEVSEESRQDAPGP